jgi:hypothetical protein
MPEAGPGSVVADRGSVAIGMVSLQRRPETASLPVWLAPRPEFLAGREGLLGELDARLTAPRERPGVRVVALCGLGGAGKTSVAVEYAHRCLAEVAVCWQFPAEDETVLAAEFAVLAAQLGARDVADARDPVASVLGVLARQETGWLLVFDNAPDRAAVERFLPPAGPGRVLITTQSQHWPPGQVLDVPVLDTEVAADFLVNRTGDADRAAAGDLAAELGGLPLALEQAAAYMQATGTSLARYLPLFRARQADLLARGETAGHRQHTSATLGLAFSRLERDAPAAVGLLRLLAFLAPEPVPLGLLLDGQDATQRLGAQTAGMVGPLLGDPIAVADSVAALRRYSLTAPAGDGLVQVHRLVQAITRDRLTAGEARRWRQAAAAVVGAAIPADAELPRSWPTCAVLLPHARAVLDLTSDGISRLAQYLGYSGSYQAARDLFALTADAHGESGDYGPEHPETLGARGNLAYWTGQAGEAAAARDQLTALLPAFERILGPDHPDTLGTRGALTYWTGEAGDPAAARDQLTALLPIRERSSAPTTPTPSPPAAPSPTGPGRPGTRPQPATSSPPCSPSVNASSAPTTPTPSAPAPTSLTGPVGRRNSEKLDTASRTALYGVCGDAAALMPCASLVRTRVMNPARCSNESAQKRTGWYSSTRYSWWTMTARSRGRISAS